MLTESWHQRWRMFFIATGPQCDAWGGCGGGKWGRASADQTLAVGRRAAVTTMEATAGGAGFEYSTTAGGECDGSDKPVCSWKTVGSESWAVADSACVTAAVVAAASAGADADGAIATLDAAFADGSPCRI